MRVWIQRLRVKWYKSHYAQWSMRESRISPTTADDVLSCSSVREVSKNRNSREQGHTKGGFDDANLCCRRVKASECTPIVDDETSTDDVRATVDSTSLGGVRWMGSVEIAMTYDQGNLEQRAQLVLVLYARFGMYEATLI